MASREPLSRGDIMSRVGIERDVMTFWIRGGVLQPMAGPTGPGKHLRFAWYEANIAAVMNQLRILGVKIGGMLSIGRGYREAIAYFEGLSVSPEEASALYAISSAESRAIGNQAERARYRKIISQPGFDSVKYAYMVKAAINVSFIDELRNQILEEAQGRSGQEGITPRLIEIWRNISREIFDQYYWIYRSISEQPEVGKLGWGGGPEGMTYFWRDGEGDEYRFAIGVESIKPAHEGGAISMIAIDVAAALDQVWINPVSKEDSE